MEYKGLEKKVISYWMIWRMILLVIISAGLIVGVIFTPQEFLLLVLIPGGLLWLCVAFYALILPGLQHKVYKYYVDDEKVVVSKGVLFRTYTITPIVQVQDIGSSQGPIQILYNISNVVLSTAGSTGVIHCIDNELAKQIVDDIQVKVRQRLAKENNNATL